MNKQYRKGAVGALMDEYERATEELKKVLKSLQQSSFTTIVDHDTQDADCRSIQTIMNHVVRSGYGYANYIRTQFGDNLTPRKENYDLTSPEIACEELDRMIQYTIETLYDKWGLSDTEMMQNQMKVSWGPIYDFEQLFEHAIVHILRHRRQIERFVIIQSSQE